MTLKDLFKKIWLSDLLGPAIIAGAFIFVFVSKDGFLLSYLKASGWLIFIFSFICTVYAVRKIKKWCFLNNRSNLWSGLSQIPLFFLFLYSIHTISDYAVRATGYPDYVLFPCSYEPTTALEIKEAKKFWKMRDVDTFNCDPEPSNQGN